MGVGEADCAVRYQVAEGEEPAGIRFADVADSLQGVAASLAGVTGNWY